MCSCCLQILIRKFRLTELLLLLWVLSFHGGENSEPGLAGYDAVQPYRVLPFLMKHLQSKGESSTGVGLLYRGK